MIYTTEEYLKLANEARGNIQSRDTLITAPPFTIKLHAICKMLYVRKLYRGPSKSLEDMQQDVYVKVLKGIGKTKKPFESVDGFEGWLYKIALNAGRRDYRQDKFRLEETAEGILENLKSYFPSYEDSLLLLEIEEILKTQLKPREVKIFLLKVVDGLNVTEIAEELGCQREIVYRCQKKILKILAPFNLKKV
jgi:RNA polymerase sigma factor (sigma-70 family)